MWLTGLDLFHVNLLCRPLHLINSLFLEYEKDKHLIFHCTAAWEPEPVFPRQLLTATQGDCGVSNGFELHNRPVSIVSLLIKYPELQQLLEFLGLPQLGLLTWAP